MDCDHQIPMPDDRAIQYFLWESYFHDSHISNIGSNRSGKMEYGFPNRAELTVHSIRDIDDDKTLPKEYGERQRYIQEHQDKYTYHLIFEGCCYISSERLSVCNDILFGTFLDSALLRKIQRESDRNGENKKYYHYRFIFDDGYMDLIFTKFRIRKMTGRVRYPSFELVQDYPLYRLNWMRDETAQDIEVKPDIDWVLRQLETGTDEARRYGLMYLVITEKWNVAAHARNILKLNWVEYDEARTAAIWVLGLQGDESDLPTLFEEYFSIEQRYASEGIGMSSALLPKRHILDAIEHIRERCPLKIDAERDASRNHRALTGVAYRLGR